MAGGATPAITALVAAQVPHTVLRFHHDRHVTAFGAEAVGGLAAAGIAAEQVFKTLVLAVPGAGAAGVAVAVLPVPARLSVKAAAAALSAPKAALADPAVAQRATGYRVGGISPFGQRRALPTVVDASVWRWPQVVCSAGRRGWDVALAPADLIALTQAVTADLVAV
ncbi:Cys-tRNA(Pro) deacylase [Mycobacterium koreense]|uniref:Cys-tRNA(Pro)/Cys-tRNA(Cys) deacylase n=1 Tax=Mycolicibacillus koreensis TaxID=1069220 RepID=A0A7I7SDC8_9MYCO|nr:YbaK/EbsC family protein [Mycolicibacillus koreensis]MCV7249912.1 Cys-tRNA(Pro) deacylase [Mycolicibacillus koreensis]OSC34869.1 aminoacyl-tRNA deacylase [Mycolicibacillus koreensis]BBY54733.1 Cys-tRNA(Pro)/Cys-tRNA(Cys) deacylase [Mycolicibacillus koreensis]